jgi:hypothetical protein
MGKTIVTGLVAVAAGIVLAHAVLAQHPPAAGGGATHPHHGHGMPHHGAAAPASGPAPTLPGQDAFGAIAEVVRLLEADPATDWSTVDVERLRQHLIDMHEVVLRAAVRPARVPGGLAMEVTGTGRTEQAIRAMMVPHAAELDRMAEWSARTETIPGGVRLVVLARRPDDARLVARIRGLGFAGLLTAGAHHQPHHLAMARGAMPAGHRP